MPPRTATSFSLSLFPQVFLFERVLKSDVVFLLSDRRLDAGNHANECILRSAYETKRKIEIPVSKKGFAIDDVPVPDRSNWFSDLQKQVHHIYSGLPLAEAACDLVSESLPDFDSPWLTDYLMHAFVVTLQRLGLEKEIIRGSRVERQGYVDDSEYLLGLCKQHDCDRLIVGRSEIYRGSPFRSAGIRLENQQWHGSAILPARDSILDAVARLSAEDILRNIYQN